MAKTLTIGDRNASDLAEITDTRWDSNGTMFVTVREMIGGFESWKGGKNHAIRIMRTLARRAIHHPEETRKSPIVNIFHDGASHCVTFAVSRNS